MSKRWVVRTGAILLCICLAALLGCSARSSRIVGEWVNASGASLKFTDAGDFVFEHDGTPVAGSYKVVDESTVLLKAENISWIDGLASGELTCKVTWDGDDSFKLDDSIETDTIFEQLDGDLEFRDTSIQPEESSAGKRAVIDFMKQVSDPRAADVELDPISKQEYRTALAENYEQMGYDPALVDTFMDDLSSWGAQEYYGEADARNGLRSAWAVREGPDGWEVYLSDADRAVLGISE